MAAVRCVGGDKQITPELEAEIDRLAQAYARAGQNADEARDKLQQIQAQSDRGKDAMQNMFGSIIDGSMSAKDAVAQLLLEIAEAQMLKGLMGLPGMESLSGLVGGLLSFDGGGYTGNGTRTGGIDGKGGMVALVHPRETITDHTKGQQAPRSPSAPQKVHVTVGVDPQSGNLTAFVDSRASTQVKQAAPQIVGQSVQASQRSMRKSKGGWGL